MAAGTFILPAGTVVTKQIPLPLSGGWCGLSRVRMSTYGVDATLHEWLFIWSGAPSSRTYYRRTATASTNNWYNSTLKKDKEELRWLGQNESIMRLTYTATNDISLVWETNRSILPTPGGQSINLAQWNKTANTVPALWTTGATGNNLASSNPTEIRVGNLDQLNGVSYWKPTT